MRTYTEVAEARDDKGETCVFNLDALCSVAHRRSGASELVSVLFDCLTLAPSGSLDLIHFPPHLQNPVKLPSVATATFISLFLYFPF